MTAYTPRTWADTHIDFSDRHILKDLPKTDLTVCGQFSEMARQVKGPNVLYYDAEQKARGDEVFGIAAVYVATEAVPFRGGVTAMPGALIMETYDIDFEQKTIRVMVEQEPPQ